MECEKSQFSPIKTRFPWRIHLCRSYILAPFLIFVNPPCISAVSQWKAKYRRIDEGLSDGFTAN